MQSCNETNNFGSENDKFKCKDNINDSISIFMFGTVEDVGLTDMIFHRTIHLIKDEDSLLIPIQDSEFRGLRCANVQLPDSTTRLILYNREKPSYVIVDPVNFIVDNSPPGIDKIIGSNIYDLNDQSIFLCPIPGTINQ